MQQLLLDVFTPPEPTLENFVQGNNQELLAQLFSLTQDIGHEQVVLIYGTPGSGKTHLLTALAKYWAVPIIDGRHRLVWRNQSDILLLDDAQNLSPYSQVQLFNAFNESRASGLPKLIVATANAHPSLLKLRPDLISRMGWGLTYRIEPLSEEQKRDVLISTAHAKGLKLDEEVIQYALIHFHRDMGSLSAVLNGLDTFSLEQKKPVTLYLLRQWMKKREGILVRNSEVTPDSKHSFKPLQ